MRNILLSILVAAMLAACAGPTPYQRQIDGRGYHEEQMSKNRFRVMFTGNARTAREDIENYVLFRAAELTLETGNDYFIVLDQGSDRFAGFQPSSLEREQQSYETSGEAEDPLFGTLATGSVRPAISHQVVAVIEVGAGARPRDELNVFNAQETIDRLRPLILFAGQNQL